MGLRKYGSETTVMVILEEVAVAEVDVEAVAELLQTLAELTLMPSLEP
jgi:hypothetical protein